MKKNIILGLISILIFSSCIGANKDIELLQKQIDEIKELPTIKAEITPLEAVIVSDDTEMGNKIEQLKKQMFKNLKYRVVASSSDEGKKLIEKFSATYLPMMVTGEGIKTTEIKDYLTQLATEVSGEYNVDLASIGGQTGIELFKSYLKTPMNLPHDGVKGPDGAKVTFIEISDFECPYCKRFYEGAYKEIIEEYGDQIQVRFKNLPLSFHPKAQKAAEAAQCALKQNKFWEMHDKLFENQENLSEDNYKKWAVEMGMSSSQFNTCLDNGETMPEVDAHIKQAQAFGVQGTPGLFINNIFVGGAYPFEHFKNLIDKELAK